MERVENMTTEHGEEMRKYLAPYIDLDDEKAKGFAVGEENNRKQVAYFLKSKLPNQNQ